MDGSFEEDKKEQEMCMDEFLPNKLPWDYQDESISVALTGKAFKHLQERQ